jgi:hypothetical protein
MMIMGTSMVMKMLLLGMPGLLKGMMIARILTNNTLRMRIPTGITPNLKKNRSSSTTSKRLTTMGRSSRISAVAISLTTS